MACLALTIVLAQGASAAAQVQSAPIVWREQAFIAGELLKVRAGYEVARELVKPGTSWELRAGNTAIPASLAGSAGINSATPLNLPFKPTSAATAADLTVVTDQGTSLGRMNTLRFSFSVVSLQCTVRFETSADGKTYQAIGREQVLYQELTAGKIIALTEASIDFAAQKYLRITFVGARGAALKEILATYVPASYGEREIPVTFGPMATAADASSCIWPLKLASPQDLVTRLELQADAPGTAREITLVTLDAQSQPLRTITRFVWADRLAAGGIQRSSYGVTLAGLDPAMQYGLMTKAGDPVFPLTAVKAYTCDVWLVFYTPAKADLMLWLNPVTQYHITHPLYDAAKARDVGSVGPLACLATPQVSRMPEPRAPQPLQAAQTYMGHWWRAYVYGISAVLLALLAGALLRRRADTTAD